MTEKLSGIPQDEILFLDTFENLLVGEIRIRVLFCVVPIIGNFLDGNRKPHLYCFAAGFEHILDSMAKDITVFWGINIRDKT